MRILIRIFFLLSIVISVILSTSWLWFNNLYFHTDIARDFLILQDMYYGRHITLLGPRAGGIEGVFHGPLWFYLNLPAYIIGQGNPVVVGWFWVLLYIVLIILVFIVAKKLYGDEIAYISSSLVAVQGIDMTKMLLNPYGAVLVSPLIFYFFYQYAKYNKTKDLIYFVLLVGIAIQFEMAFAIPVLLLGIIYSIIVSIRSRKIQHILAYALLVLPLSTFILFDVRHQFLQTKAFTHYLFSSHKITGGFNLAFTQSRISHLLDVTNMFAAQKPVLSFIVVTLFICLLVIDRKRKDPLWIFAYFYTGYAIVSYILFKGDIWSYYTMPFLPFFAIVFTARALQSFYKPLVYILLIIIVLFGLQKGVNEMLINAPKSAQDGSAWQFNKKLAESLYSQNRNRPFGYYVYTPDLFGYGPRYAMDYIQRKTGRYDIYPYQKKDVTYLIMSPAPFHSALGPTDWKKNEVKIQKNPDKKITYSNGYRIEIYKLTKEEQEVESNQNMVQSVIMR